MATGCGCKEVYRFPHSTYPYSSSILFILLNVFLSCSSILFVIKFYVLNNFFTQYRHTYGQLWASHDSHMKVAHNDLYMKKHTKTYASYPVMDNSCMT